MPALRYASRALRTVLALVVLAASADAIAACGGQTTSGAAEEDAGADATLPRDAGNTGDSRSSDTADGAGNPGDSGSSDVAGGARSCPASSPSTGSSCAKNGLQCTYGTGPHLACRIAATCNGVTWNERGCDAGACPASAAPGAACPSNGESCGYAGGVTCDCYACLGACSPNAQNTWHCATQPSGCPSTAPNLGTECTGDASCDYGGCTGGWSLACEDGAWTRVFTPCPG